MQSHLWSRLYRHLAGKVYPVLTLLKDGVGNGWPLKIPFNFTFRGCMKSGSISIHWTSFGSAKSGCWIWSYMRNASWDMLTFKISIFVGEQSANSWEFHYIISFKKGVENLQNYSKSFEIFSLLECVFEFAANDIILYSELVKASAWTILEPYIFVG